MPFVKWTLPTAAMAILFFGLVGCNPSDVTETDGEATAPAAAEMDHNNMDHDGHDMDGHDHLAHSAPQGAEEIPAAKSDMDKMMDALANLPEEDRKSAMKQHFCPVSGEMLGVMGAPEKVDVNGQSVWICCDGCKDKLLADPEKYLAKLNK
ncbi:hypothetical protein [Planctomycetes bacterium TBK1r]|uniref:Secreted protein n=1 Tax=Stieleria magnilauensis TaxID=2527963 RepID=A0ABX5XNX9_9BACT|nr:hypothetical protein TBK1r_26550 [Planctomycetes bacterium TBK1r]